VHVQGTVTHTQSYRGPDEYKGKRVLVVGIGNSAMDVAVELCSFSKKVRHRFEDPLLSKLRILCSKH
jgi:cation diffusion facilitator CzcD-associated flavoprotein CzcO